MVAEEYAGWSLRLKWVSVATICSQSPRGDGPPCLDGTYLRLSFYRPSGGFFAMAAIPAARSFAMRPMSFTGTGLVNGNWTVPFRSS
jgi:hypothetical protein